MSNWSVLKAAVSDAIKTNGNQEITGAILQETLLNIVSAMGRHATFAGVATPATRPGTYDGPTFYIAMVPGTYPNFGGAKVVDGRLGIFYTTADSSSWQLGSILVTTPISDGSITTEKIEDAAVTRDKLAINSVHTTELCDGAVTYQKLAPAVQAMLSNAGESELLQYYDRVRSSYLQIVNGNTIQYDTDEIMLGRTWTGNLDDLDNEAIYLEAATQDHAGVMTADDKAALDGLVELIESDSNGAINKFNEIVKFLAGISDTSTLQGLLGDISIQIARVRNTAITRITSSSTVNEVRLNIFKGESEEASNEVPLPMADTMSPGLMSSVDKNTLSGYFKNAWLCDEGWANRKIYNHNGEIVTSPYLVSSPMMPIDPANTTILLNGGPIYIQYFSAAKTFISQTAQLDQSNLNKPAKLYSVHPAEAAYFCVVFNPSSHTPPHAEYMPIYNGYINVFNNLGIAAASIQQAAKKALFIDKWNSYSTALGFKYDPENAPDIAKPFYANKLWLSYEEALIVDTAGPVTPPCVVPYGNFASPLVTNIVAGLSNYTGSYDNPVNIAGLFRGNSRIVVANLSTGNSAYPIKPSSMLRTFERNVSLREVIGIIDMSACTQAASVNTAFLGCAALEDIQLKNLKVSINFGDSPLLSLASLQYMIANAANTAIITITVNSRVYTKLIDEANTDWHKVLTDAETKNIQFVAA